MNNPSNDGLFLFNGGNFFRRFYALSAYFYLFSANRHLLQIKVLPFYGFDIGMAARSGFLAAAPAFVASSGHKGWLIN